MVVFPNLEVLEIFGIENLQEIFHNQVPHDLFCQLRELKIFCCHKLSRVAKSNIIPSLKNLRKLMVGDCNSIVEIFEGNVATSFLELEHVRLDSLPKLKISIREIKICS